MADPQNDDFAVVIINSIKHSIRSASCAPDAFQLTSKGSANSLRVLEERTSYEVDDGKSHCFGKLLTDGADRWSRNYELVAGVGHLGRRALTASTPRTTSSFK